MTAASLASLALARPTAMRWAPPAGICLVLLAIVGARLLAVRAGVDPLLVGASFGTALAGLALVGRLPRRRARPAWSSPLAWRAIGAGAGVGLALAALAVVGPAIGGSTHNPGLGRPAAALLPWAVVTTLVAAGEEGVLRGVLFERLEHVAGLLAAVTLTSLAFALMHVPLYGWHVVPLDLAVGVVFVGLRIATRGLAAPIAAHAVADLATWWI